MCAVQTPAAQFLPAAAAAVHAAAKDWLTAAKGVATASTAAVAPAAEAYAISSVHPHR